MKMNCLKQGLSKLCIGLLVGIMSMTPIMAQVPMATASVMSENSQTEPSDWAIETIIEGQNYGIYPIEWHENFKARLTMSDIDLLRGYMALKLFQTNDIIVKEEKKAIDIKDNTRGEVLKQLFWVLNQFEYSKDIGINNVDAITFMKQHGIITGEDLYLTKACTRQEAIVFSTRLIDYIYEKLDAGTKGYFFKVEGGKNEVYLFGSVHAADSRLYPFDHKILETYKKSDVIGFEIDLLDDADYDKFAQLTRYSDGTCLKDHVSKETYELAVKCGKAVGLNETKLNKLKAWYLSNYISTGNLSQSRDVDETEDAADYGIDNYFYYKALSEGKEIVGLESYELQAQMFDSFSDKLQEHLLLDNLYNFLYYNIYFQNESDPVTNDLWLNLIKNGDVEGFKKYYTIGDEYLGDEALTKEYIEKLLTKRDSKMTDKIKGYLQSDSGKSYFIVVGTAHYVSPTGSGVINQLEKAGYKVTQIK